jgi:hypothetical protein
MPTVAALDEGVDVNARELLGGGHVTATTALDGYLCYLEATTNTNSPFLQLHRAVAALEERPESSFARLFSAHLSLGMLSRRRAYATALEYERLRNGGRLMPFGLFSAFTARQVVKSMEGQDFHQSLARAEQTRTSAVPAAFLNPEGAPPNRMWRWRGHLISYIELESAAGPDAPAILLTHGFGAMGEHYRGTLYPVE